MSAPLHRQASSDQTCQKSLPTHAAGMQSCALEQDVQTRAGCYRDGGAAALLGRMAGNRWLRNKPLVDPADRWQASLSKVREVLRHAALWPGVPQQEVGWEYDRNLKLHLPRQHHEKNPSDCDDRPVSCNATFCCASASFDRASAGLNLMFLRGTCTSFRRRPVRQVDRTVLA